MIELVENKESLPGIREGHFRKSSWLVEGEENETESCIPPRKSWWPNCVRLNKLHMSLCPADRPADSFYLSTCYVPTGIPAVLGHNKQLFASVSRLKYQGTKPIILSGPLLQQDCRTQGLANSWSWRLLDTAVQKVFIQKDIWNPASISDRHT